MSELGQQQTYCEHKEDARRAGLNAPRSVPIKQDGYRLFVQRVGSHATPSATAAATTSLSGRFEISV
ncbi:hypothetical protein ABIB95_001183 [Bradyrhizobium sp. LA2.1]